VKKSARLVLSADLAYISRMTAPQSPRPETERLAPPPEADKDDDAWMVAGVDEAIAEVEAGAYVLWSDVEAWIESWGKPDELPLPPVRYRNR